MVPMMSEDLCAEFYVALQHKNLSGQIYSTLFAQANNGFHKPALAPEPAIMAT